MDKGKDKLRTLLVKISLDVEEIDPQGGSHMFAIMSSHQHGTAETLLEDHTEQFDASRTAHFLGDAVKEAIRAAGLEVGEKTAVWLQTTPEDPRAGLVLCVPIRSAR